MTDAFDPQNKSHQRSKVCLRALCISNCVFCDFGFVVLFAFHDIINFEI